MLHRGVKKQFTNLKELKPDEASEVFYKAEEFSGRAIDRGKHAALREGFLRVVLRDLRKAEVTVGEDKIMLQ